MPLCRTFIVEDSAVSEHNLKQALEEMTEVLVVGGAHSELDAVRWLIENADAYDLVIVDVFLRGGSGLGVLRSARALMGDSTLVVLTNYATPEIRRACIDLGATQVFDKSTQLHELIEFCRQIGDNIRAPRPYWVWDWTIRRSATPSQGWFTSG